ncbi:hypothetical protein FKP32DRAFT_1587507 [Trametes sanguinea]|nr:hypothetical protein FKP32DRAFT_1587507 [Trametes sanguinea]
MAGLTGTRNSPTVSTESDSWGAPSTSAGPLRTLQNAKSVVRDDWDDDEADLPEEEDPQRLWEEANARAPVPQVVIAGSSTSAALSAPPAAFQPVMRILKRPSASPSPSSSSSGSPTANDQSASKSYAEREARYQAARERIFGESRPATEATDAQPPETGGGAAVPTPVRITREPRGPPSASSTETSTASLGATSNAYGTIERGFSSRRGATRDAGHRDG